ncbi:MAG: hypothetical protein WA705_01675 [Candidatus Ozemobacteraceae bacterium]
MSQNKVAPPNFSLIILLCSFVFSFFSVPASLAVSREEPNKVALWEILKNPQSNIGLLSYDSSRIRRVIKSPKTTGGSQNAGIAVVESEAGRFVLKIYGKRRRFSKLQYSILIQWYLGKFGICPKISGILQNDQMNELQRRGLLPGDLEASFGVLMELVPGAWNFTREKEVPKEAKSWDHRRNSDYMYSLRPLTEKLGIIAHDPQFLVSDGGKVYYSDLDLVWYVSPSGMVLGDITEEDLKRFLQYDPNGLRMIKNDSFDQVIPIYTSNVKRFLTR